MNIAISKAEVFKLSNEKCLINLYLEETAPNKGRVIVSISDKIYQRFYDGAGGGLKTFLSKINLTDFVHSLQCKPSEVEHIIKALKPFWEEFQETISQ